MVKHSKIGNMTKKDKELLLKDLYARLPYGVEVKSSARKKSITLSLDVMVDFYLGYSVKPYLRPMSSITEEEKCQFRKFVDWTYDCNWESNSLEGLLNENRIISQYAIELFDWLYAHHIDFRGWIKKDLALSAPEGMYNFKSII